MEGAIHVQVLFEGRFLVIRSKSESFKFSINVNVSVVSIGNVTGFAGADAVVPGGATIT